ncbi:shikimate kinase [Bacillus sp. FJAT-42315]|uniref:shikimate kinase n=1 Tax=Bacillus sp. FJAT-42315 TaxID=2014077 RepID=UPI000C244312|nr:shikimate kinase [Bacillus sp. FJAT-42315]
MTTIFITGFMGAGKTTIGQLLANQLQIPVIDTDVYIEQREGAAISEIFGDKGEAYFREAETAALQQFCTNEQKIVTTGGGIIMKEQNRQLMKKHGVVIFLEVDLAVIFDRLKGDTSRPLIQNQEQARIQELYESRLPLYREAANLIIHTTDQTAEQVAEEVIQRLKLEENGETNTV